jgi:cytochrome c556
MTKSSILAVAAVLLAAAAAPDAVAAPNGELKALMRQLGSAASAEDTKAMAPLLAKTKGFAKPDMPNWAALSEKGEKAAMAGDLAGAKATCKGCHDAYKATYKSTYGSKAP